MINALPHRTPRRIVFTAPIRLSYGGKAIIVPGMLDTGTERTIVSFNELRRLGVPIEKMLAASVVRGAKGTHKAVRVVLDKMEVVGENCAVSPMPVTAIAALRVNYILVGMDFLRAVGARIDFSKGRFECLKKAVQRANAGDRKIVLPFIFRNGDRQIERAALVDTGATEIVIPTWMASRLGIKVHAAATRLLAVGVSVTIKRGMIDSIQLKGTPCTFGPFSVTILDLPSPVIGNAFMLKAKAVIDLLDPEDEFKIVCPLA
jgi:predicted aspartyl protease